MSFEVEIDMDDAVKKFTDQIFSLFLRSKKDAAKIAGTNFRGVVKNLFGLTPPMWSSFIRPADSETQKPGGIKVDFEKGQQASDKTIAKDLKKAMWTLASRNKLAGNDLPNHGMSTVRKYLEHRNARKRYGGGLGNRPVSEYDIDLTSRVLKNRQGWTAGGWAAAASYFGVPGVPAWVKRFSRGFGIMTPQGDGIRMVAFNPTNHYNSAQIQARVAIAINMQANAMERDMLWYFNTRAKQSGLK